MQLVQENDDALKASIAGAVELLRSSITKTQADLDNKSQETHAAVQTLHDHLAAAASSAPTGAAPEAPPGLPFHQELEALKRRLPEHDLNPSHLLDPTVITQRLARVGAALAALSADRATGAASAPTQMGGTPAQAAPTAQGTFAPPAQDTFDPWSTVQGTGAAPQNFGPRLSGAAEGGRPETNPFSTRRPFGPSTAEYHEIHSLGGVRGGQLKLDLKLARIDKHFYRDNCPETRHKNVRSPAGVSPRHGAYP